MATVDRVWAPDSLAYDDFFKAACGNNVDDLNKALTPDININALQSDGFEGQAALHMAASNGNIEMVRLLLAHGADVNILDLDREGSSQPLHMAAYRARPDIVKLLLDSGAESKKAGFLGETALGQVLLNEAQVKPEHIETIRRLLDFGLDVNEACVLEQAACLRHLPLIKMLLDRGARMNPMVPTERSVLSRAANDGHYDTVKFLIDNGAKVDNPVDGNPTSALLSAASAGKIDVFKLLLAHADEATKSKNSGALHLSASSGHVSLVELMLDRRFNIEAKDQIGNTPLLSVCATSQAYPQVVTLLLSRGADVNARNKKGDTPLHVAAWRSDPEVVRLLLEAGSNLTGRNDEGQTPLIRFATQITGVCPNNFHAHGKGRNPRLEVFKLLLHAGSNLNAKDLRRRTALHALVLQPGLGHMAQGQLEAAKLLLQNGIEVEAVDVDGKTASQSFSHCDSPELFKLLLNSQSDLVAQW
ncbi:MAG: hypothetical protein M1830_005079 [Pleopsidium flavum]|nr:MAG: hypothetical protein M1830_005079 [Pleopsidium flavum]